MGSCGICTHIFGLLTPYTHQGALTSQLFRPREDAEGANGRDWNSEPELGRSQILVQSCGCVCNQGVSHPIEKPRRLLATYQMGNWDRLGSHSEPPKKNGKAKALAIFRRRSETAEVGGCSLVWLNRPNDLLICSFCCGSTCRKDPR